MFSIPSSVFCKENLIISSPAAQLFFLLLCGQFLAFQIKISSLIAEGPGVKKCNNGIIALYLPSLVLLCSLVGNVLGI